MTVPIIMLILFLIMNLYYGINDNTLSSKFSMFAAGFIVAALLTLMKDFIIIN